MIQKALADRLAAVETQRDLAASTDFPASAWSGKVIARLSTPIPVLAFSPQSVHFADGSSEDGDSLIGADGIRPRGGSSFRRDRRR